MRRLRHALVAPALFGILGLAACGGGTATSPPAAATQAPAPASQAAAACADSTDAATVNVAIANFAFDPQTIQASVGDVVGWTNNDTTAHSAVITGTDCATDRLDPGASGAIKFTAAGSYPYVCGIHATMTGTVEVK